MCLALGSCRDLTELRLAAALSPGRGGNEGQVGPERPLGVTAGWSDPPEMEQVCMYGGVGCHRRH